MKDTLDFMLAKLRLQITTMCMHIRNRAYRPNTPAHQNALQSLLYKVLISDELSILLERYEKLKDDLRKSEIGQFGLFDEEEPVDIYQHCLGQFEGDQCPLGSSTAELRIWVSSHADRNKQLRAGFEMFFPDVKFTIVDDSAGDLTKGRDITDSEKFESQTENYLRDIEDNNALTEFNELMGQVRELLLNKAPVESILATLPVDNEQSGKAN